MADYFTHFSCLFDVGTAANAARAIEIYETAVLDGDPDHPLSDGFSASIDDEAGGTTLWISGYASGDPECVIAFVLLCAEAFDLKGLWGFEYANTCSRPRLDAYGGGAHAIDLGARKSIGWVCSYEWLTTVLAGGDPDA
ncbi:MULTISPECIES: hypothetical protein [unclassified Devosia]|uniref:hypothetical protein n=1 Tax=unclassified Devosia TaxID=196773 RepID=UPI00086ADC32|nr:MULTISPECIES: hypothetical protein [unclassified Devosia]MBN9362819.1 hypothetical protein [Devosia sp.]ODS88374.1 MAG: hypothetical protein ABS47_09615 [Devosia sp. SCN 66-27]OJX23991.1 MAG: hypothetical protein BGO83_03855 [Devosia sp. 66-14]